MNNNYQSLLLRRWIILVLAILIVLLSFLGEGLKSQSSPAGPKGPGGGGQISPPAQQVYVVSHIPSAARVLALEPGS